MLFWPTVKFKPIHRHRSLLSLICQFLTHVLWLIGTSYRKSKYCVTAALCYKVRPPTILLFPSNGDTVCTLHPKYLHCGLWPNCYS